MVERHFKRAYPVKTHTRNIQWLPFGDFSGGGDPCEKEAHILGITKANRTLARARKEWARLQAQQDSQPVLDLGHGGGGEGTQAGDEPVFADGANRFAQESGGICQAAFRGLDNNMEWDGAQSGCDGDNDDEVGAALVECVHGNDQHRAASGLLVAAHGDQISEPNVATGSG